MPLDPSQSFPVMCLTQDGLSLSHQDQAERLCGGGARWIQLRAKFADFGEWLRLARDVASCCRQYGATVIVNDSVEIALEVGADGVHLGKEDLDWPEARRRLGADRLLGGTVNNFEDLVRARECGCLDYIGVGPLHFTANKKKLAPVLGLPGVSALLAQRGQLPAWVIGGVEVGDLPGLRATGASGVAVSSALFHGGRIEENLQAFLNTWSHRAEVPAHAAL